MSRKFKSNFEFVVSNFVGFARPNQCLYKRLRSSSTRFGALLKRPSSLRERAAGCLACPGLSFQAAFHRVAHKNKRVFDIVGQAFTAGNLHRWQSTLGINKQEANIFDCISNQIFCLPLLVLFWFMKKGSK